MASGGSAKSSTWAMVGIVGGSVLLLIALLHLIATPGALASGDGPATAGHVVGALLFGALGTAALVFGLQRRRRDLS